MLLAQHPSLMKLSPFRSQPEGHGHRYNTNDTNEVKHDKQKAAESTRSEKSIFRTVSFEFFSHFLQALNT